jgi:hypothetical protein
MELIDRYFPWSIRIIIAGLFLVSAYGKVYPDPSAYATISTFEVKQLYPLGFEELIAKFFSRTLIGIEFALGILILLPFNLKRWVIPGIILMLAVFVVHLGIQIATVGNSGNCGCFGALLPMTPAEAIAKNVLSIGLLAFLLWRYGKTLPEKNNFLALTNVTTACILGMFMFVPLYKPTSSPLPGDMLPAMDTTAAVQQTATTPDPTATAATTATTSADPAATAAPAAPQGPAPTKSGFAKYYPDIDKDKKLLCFFAPSCDHCQATAKELTELRKSTPGFPPIQILFMDEMPEVIPDFFQKAGATYPYKVLEIIEFWKAIGDDKNVPGVAYIWNGNIVKFYHEPEGPTAFKKADLKAQLSK